jgi:putative ABC transport system permease protein
MFRNYITTALRALNRNKAHTIINVTGLSVGIACCLLIALFVRDELTFDTFHSRADRIYRVYAIEDWGENQRFIDVATPFPMGPALKSHLDEVELMVRIHNVPTQVKTESEQFSEALTIAGEDFLKMFDFKLLRSYKHNALGAQTSVLLTQSAVKRFFGDKDPLGSSVSLLLNDRFEDFVVAGILADPPANSSIQFSTVISDVNYPRLFSEQVLTSAWFSITPETYILLREGVTAESVSTKFPSVFKPLLGDNYEKSKYFVGLQPLTGIHLDTSLPAGITPVSDPRYAAILSAVALLVLTIACINFVTLSVGRSLRRSKEVGIRKVAGAQKFQLVTQFVGEAVLITTMALLFGIALAGLWMPIFNNLSGKSLALEPDGFLLLLSVTLVLVIGFFAGSYPALILSAFKPVTVLKGVVESGNNKQTVRKALVAIQLTLSVFLISSTLVMKKQLQYLQSKNLGFDKEQLAVIPLNVKNVRDFQDRISEGFKAAEIFKSELSKLPGIVSISASSHDFANGNWTNIGFTDSKGVYRTFYYNTVDEGYARTLKLRFVEGRNFDIDVPSDRARAIVVNEAFVRSLGWSDAVGKKIPGGRFKDHDIIGVVEDFNYSSLYTKVEPLIMALDLRVIADGIENINIENSPVPKLMIRLHAANVGETMKAVRELWNNVTNGEEFRFSFVDEALAKQYRSDQQLEKIITVASLLALIIGCLGLYGLASLAMQNRVREISIRKVLGATHSSLLLLLTRDYVMLILFSLALSVPVTWLLMDKWLTTFEYRIRMGPGIFAMAGIICLLVALITISVEVLRTASRQPAETLKYE